jgi:uncharacterized protein with GYD domain
MTSACMLIRTEAGKFEKVADNLDQILEVKRAFAVIGRFDVVVDLEAADPKSLAKLVMKVNRLAGVVYTETLPEVET